MAIVPRRLPSDPLATAKSAFDVVPSDPYPPEMLNRGEWSSNFPASNPAFYPETSWQGPQYRHQWAVTMFGIYCALKAIPALNTIYDHPDFNDYMDRYWTEELSRGFTGSSNNAHTLTKRGKFYKAFRETHTGLFA